MHHCSNNSNHRHRPTCRHNLNPLLCGPHSMHTPNPYRLFLATRSLVHHSATKRVKNTERQTCQIDLHKEGNNPSIVQPLRHAEEKTLYPTIAPPRPLFFCRAHWESAWSLSTQHRLSRFTSHISTLSSYTHPHTLW